MNSKIIAGIIALSALVLALAPVVVSQTFAFPGEQGKGHTRVNTETCTNPGGGNPGGSSSGPCPGGSAGAGPIVQKTCTTTFAGKSSVIKNFECTTQ